MSFDWYSIGFHCCSNMLIGFQRFSKILNWFYIDFHRFSKDFSRLFKDFLWNTTEFQRFILMFTIVQPFSIDVQRIPMDVHWFVKKINDSQKISMFLFMDVDGTIHFGFSLVFMSCMISKDVHIFYGMAKGLCHWLRLLDVHSFLWFLKSCIVLCSKNVLKKCDCHYTFMALTSKCVQSV